MRRQLTIAILLAVLASAPGCLCGSGAASDLSKLGKKPVRVAGEVTMSAERALPKRLKIEIVVRTGPNRPRVVAVHTIDNVRALPTSFDIDVPWNEAPEPHLRKPSKAPPSILVVHARGLVEGRELFVAAARPYTIEDSHDGRRLKLELLPVID